MEKIKAITIRDILEELFDQGKRYGEDIGYAKDEMLYEIRDSALIEAQQDLKSTILEKLPEKKWRVGMFNAVDESYCKGFDECVLEVKSIINTL